MSAIGASEDGRLILEGPHAVQPSTRAELLLTYPLTANAPGVHLRFIPFDRIQEFLAGRQEGALPYPLDLAPFPEITPEVLASPADENRAGDRMQRSLVFETDRREGVYLCIVRPGLLLGGPAADFHVVIASRFPTRFPAPQVEDLTDILVPHVNASDKNGILYLVFGAVWFAENMLNFTISDQLKSEIARAPNQPAYAPVDPETARLLMLGRPLGGVDRVWLVPEGAEEDETPCFDFSAMRETPREGGRHA